MTIFAGLCYSLTTFRFNLKCIGDLYKVDTKNVTFRIKESKKKEKINEINDKQPQNDDK